MITSVRLATTAAHSCRTRQSPLRRPSCPTCCLRLWQRIRGRQVAVHQQAAAQQRCQRGPTRRPRPHLLGRPRQSAVLRRALSPLIVD